MNKVISMFAMVLLPFLCLQGISQKQDLPNILMIYVDDLGYHDLGFTGSSIYQTPAIDQLASEGISFTNAYTNYPRCVPSRYALMSGIYPVIERKGKLSKKPEEKNFVKKLNAVGYRTAYLGKWHLGDQENSPQGFGIDFSYASGMAGGVGSRFYPFNTRKNSPGDKAPVEDVEEDGKEGDYLSDLLTTATIISYPGSITPRIDEESIVTGMDLFTTICDIVTGKPIPRIDGKSFKDVLYGNEVWNDRTVYWHSSKARPHSTGDIAASAIRQGNYKLIQYLDSNKTELFNLKEDISESHDLSSQQPEKTKLLLEALLKWKEEYQVKDNRK